MSTSTATKPATNGQSKESKAPIVRKSSKEIIKERGNKGILAIITKVAFSLAGKNGFEGTKLEGAEKSQHTMIYQLTKEGGRIDKLDEKGKQYADLIAKAKACKGDLEAEEAVYSKNVKAFIDQVSTLQAASESQSAVLRGVTFA